MDSKAASVDFFDVKSWGDLPEVAKGIDGTGKPFTQRWVHGSMEDFEFGWSRATTYDPYRAKVESLLRLAEEAQDEAAVQTLLQAAIVFTVSGVEALMQFRTPSVDEHSIDAYEAVLSTAPGYPPPRPGDKEALGRLFQVRHAIIHYGGRVTHKLFGRISARTPRNSPIQLGTKETREIVLAADRFADRADKCLGVQEPI